MDIEKPWQIFLPFGETVDASHNGFLPLEDPDPVANHPEDNAVLFPLFQYLGIEGFTLWIKVRPEFLVGLRCLAVLERRKGFGMEKEWEQKKGRKSFITVYGSCNSSSFPSCRPCHFHR